MGRTSTSQNPAFTVWRRKVPARITVPVPTEGWSAIATGRQCRTLQPCLGIQPLSVKQPLARSE